MKFRGIRQRQYSLVKMKRFSVGGLFLGACQLDYKSCLEAFELTVIDEMHSRNSGRENCNSRQARLPKDGGRPLFVMIFQEADRMALEIPIGFEVEKNV